MTPTFTKEQHNALQAKPGTVVYFVDAETQKQYAVIPAETFQKVRALVGDDDFDVKDTYAAMDEVARKAGWDDPAMDLYNDDTSASQG